MTDVLGTDLKLEAADLVVDDGDLDLVTDVDCLKQDLLSAFTSPYFFYGMSIDFGSRLAEFVHGGNDPFYMLDVRRAIAEVLEAEPRVQRDSWEIAAEKTTDGLNVTVSFLPIDRSTPETLTFIITE